MHESEPESFKVVDRRKFDAEGNRRDDNVEEQAEQPQRVEPAAAAQAPPPPPPQAVPEPAEEPRQQTAEQQRAEQDYARQKPRRGGPQAISFLEFIESLYAQAVIGMGLVPDPVTGVINRNLDLSRQMIDIIVMLREKTKGNLDPAENNTIDNILYELRMNFVALSQQKP